MKLICFCESDEHPATEAIRAAMGDDAPTGHVFLAPVRDPDPFTIDPVCEECRTKEECR